ncbi:MAG: hypothetical protein ACRYG7_13455 [Janthinobacterium lividum]
MRAILYQPGQPPQSVSVAGFVLPNETTGFVDEASRVATVLDCAPGLVDVLASGRDYVAFSVFDHEGEPNPDAMEALSDLTGTKFDIDEEDDLLRGPILFVTR